MYNTSIDFTNIIPFSHNPQVLFTILVGLIMILILASEDIIRNLFKICGYKGVNYYCCDWCSDHWMIVTIIVTLYASLSSLIKYYNVNIFDDTCSTTITFNTVCVFAAVVAYLCYNILINTNVSHSLIFHHILCIMALTACIAFNYSIGVYLIELFMMPMFFYALLCMISLTETSPRDRHSITKLEIIIMFIK